MQSLDHHELTILFLALGVLLLTARLLGDLARRLGQPSVLGEILAGLLLGPTVAGRFFPGFSDFLFPAPGHNALVLGGFTSIAIVLFLLVAGMEVDLSTVWRQGRRASIVGLAGILFPFVIGFGAAWVAPEWLGRPDGAALLPFALFMATALSISALPVIAKTLMDLNLYRTDIGMIIIAAAIFNDLVGWIIFAIILGMMGQEAGSYGITFTITMTLTFAAFMLTLGRWMIHRSLPAIDKRSEGAVLAFALILALFGAAFAEWIGVHAIFGSFLVGVAVGDSSHLREQTRAAIDRFISYFFAPLFFATIGLRVDFVANFDPLLTVVVLVIACVGKVVGCGVGGRLAGMESSEAWAIGFGMNARGSMEIILGLLALQYGVINHELFVALVIMALVTSMISGPAMQRMLGKNKPRSFIEFLKEGSFAPHLQAEDRRAAIDELCHLVASKTGLKAAQLRDAVWEREQIMSTGLSDGLAIPHAHIEGLKEPVVAIGLSEFGVDFDASDGAPATIILLILTPDDDHVAQVELVADVVRILRNSDRRTVLRHATRLDEVQKALLPLDPAGATHAG